MSLIMTPEVVYTNVEQQETPLKPTVAAIKNEAGSANIKYTSLGISEND